MKMRRAHEVGMGTAVIELAETITTADFITTVERVAIQTDGIIVQLPLPDHLDTELILASIPPQMDVDAVDYDGESQCPIHPVAGAIAAIAAHHAVDFTGKQVTIVGQGRLVGQPAAAWAKRQGAVVTVITKETTAPAEAIATADILILGAGQPGLITPKQVKPGVIIFDAGTSELGGELVGDATSSCAKVAALITPVPGGIGPVTIAILLKNLLGLQVGESR